MEKLEEGSKYTSVKQKPYLLTRWWINTREVTPVIYENGLVGACHEFYVPVWAWPFELLHRLIFGSTKLIK
jgi:hypothetical protein